MNKNRATQAWISVLITGLLLLFARVIYPELVPLGILLTVLFLGSLAFLAAVNKTSLKGRAGAYGLNSVITVLLVFGIVGVLNFMAARYPQKLDLTKGGIHTLSEQTVKVVKSLVKPVKVTLWAPIGMREQFRPLLDNYKGLNPKFEVEYVDSDREITRAKTAGIRKHGTLQLQAASRESKVEEVTEEKLTNALIKLLKDKTPILCPITGHGERSFSSTDADGYDSVRKGLLAQSYEIKDTNILAEKKVPETCDAIAIVGATRAFFGPEIEAIRNYLDGGGRAILAFDLNVKSGEFAPELVGVLESWHVKPVVALVVDPISRMLGVDASVPVLPTFSKDSAITRDFGGNMQAYFPIMRPLEALPNPPAGLQVSWLAQSTPKSFAVSDFKQLSTGQVSEEGQKKGPFNGIMSVDGKKKDSKAARNTRLVIFGSANFASNQYARFGSNLDIILNSVSWAMEDESVISIRAKDEGAGKIELSQKQGSLIGLLTVFVIPLAIAIAGVVIWVLRRRL